MSKIKVGDKVQLSSDPKYTGIVERIVGDHWIVLKGHLNGKITGFPIERWVKVE